jgi:hypothetical protein
MAKVSFSRLCEQNTKREREWRIKYRASRVSSPFRSRARADFFVFFFSRGELCGCGFFASENGA